MVTHSASLPLPRRLSTAKTINTVAGRLPLFAQRPAHPVIPIPQGPIARHRHRLPEGVRSSESRRGRVRSIPEIVAIRELYDFLARHVRSLTLLAEELFYFRINMLNISLYSPQDEVANRGKYDRE